MEIYIILGIYNWLHLWIIATVQRICAVQNQGSEILSGKRVLQCGFLAGSILLTFAGFETHEPNGTSLHTYATKIQQNF